MKALLSSLTSEVAEEVLDFGHDQITFSSGDDRAQTPLGHHHPSIPTDVLKTATSGLKKLSDDFKALCPLDLKSALLEAMHKLDDVSTGASRALLSFLALVSPDADLAKLLHDAPERFLHKISSTFEHSLLPGSDHSSVVEYLSGAPETISPVKATLGWQQDGQGRLVLVWRLIVEMENNWWDPLPPCLPLRFSR